MTKEELILFIKENLSVSVSVNGSYEYDNKYLSVRVSLMLDGEEISSDETSTNIN